MGSALTVLRYTASAPQQNLQHTISAHFTEAAGLCVDNGSVDVLTVFSLVSTSRRYIVLFALTFCSVICCVG